MKILFATADWAAVGGGGMTRFSKGLAAGLAELSHTVDVLVEDRQAGGDSALLTVTSASSPLGRARAFARGIRRYQERNGYDLVVCASWSPAGTGAYLSRRKTGLPFWVVAHGNDVLEPQRSRFYTWLMKRVLAAARGILCNSRYTAGLVESIGMAPGKVTVVGCGIDPDELGRFEAAPLALPDVDPGRHRTIVTIGRLVARKGQDTMIEALPMIRRKVSDCRYVVVGDGPDRERLERLAVKHGVAEDVVFAGFLSDDDTYAMLRQSDVFAMLSRDIPEDGEVEGFGIVFLEAGYFGKPVVAGDAGGMADAVADGETGFLVDPLDAGAVAERVALLLGDAALAGRMGAAGRERALDRFTWEKVAGRVEAALEGS